MQLLPGLHVCRQVLQCPEAHVMMSILPLNPAFTPFLLAQPDQFFAASATAVLLSFFVVQLLPGLHVCGEVLDVFGRIGGFNFLWAWVTGVSAELAVSADLEVKTHLYGNQ
jgi:hypothetical protein